MLKNRFRRIVMPFVYGMLLMVPFVLTLFGLVLAAASATRFH